MTQQTPATKRPISGRRKAAFAIVTVLLILGAVEVAARLFSDERPGGRFRQISEIVSFLSREDSTQILEYDAETFWKLRPGITIHRPKSILFQGIVSNSLGYRNREFPLSRPESTLRIVCFGDSSTFGIGTPDKETWPAQLETSLNAGSGFAGRSFNSQQPCEHVEVVNAGVPGYSSYQILQRMRRELRQLSPDVVLVTCANNDLWRWDDRTDSDQAARLAGSLLRRTLLHSRAIQLADECYADFAGSRQTHDAEWARKASLNYFDPEETWMPRVPLEAFGENLRAMADLCEEQQVPLILVIWPDQLQAAGRWSVRIVYHDAMFKVAAERRLPVADVGTEFRQRPWSVHCYIPNDIVHVNAEGNRIAAEAARNALVQLDLDSVPSPPGGEGARRAGEGEVQSGKSTPIVIPRPPHPAFGHLLPRGGKGRNLNRLTGFLTEEQ